MTIGDFRVIIEGKVIYCTLKQLANGNLHCLEHPMHYMDGHCNTCTHYKILKWLNDGNTPDYFTGGQDCHKKNIYSGDIVKFNYNPILGEYSEIFELVSEVFFDKEKACYCVIARNEDPEKSIKLGLFQVINEDCRIEIIGNKHIERF